MIQWIKDNLRIIRVMNSCNYKEFKPFMNYIMDGVKPERYFVSKRYAWNIMRPRDFYKMSAMWIIDMIKVSMEEPDQSHAYLMKAEKLIKIILQTTKDQSICKSFIWNIMKSCPLVTIDTIQYASAEKLHQLLTGDKEILCDDIMKPIIDVIMNYRELAKTFQTIAEVDTDV